MPKKIRRPGNPIGRVARPRQWLRSGTGSGGTPPGPSGPAFHALTYDPNTYEMLGVKTGTGDLTTTHADTLYAPDHEGVQRAFGADEPVWAGGRVVQLEGCNSENVANWTVAGGATITPGQPDPDGGNTAVRFDPVGNNGQVRFNPTNLVTYGADDSFSGSVWIKRIAGTSNLKAFVGRVGLTVEIVGISDDWQRMNVNNIMGAEAVINFILIDQSYTAGDLYDIWHPQLELITGRGYDHATDQDTFPPSEYRTTTTGFETHCYANLNGNTVTDNVVTEAVGAPLTEMPYLQYYPASTNSLVYSRDLTLWTDIGATVVYDQTGSDGTPNAACTLTDSDAGATSARRRQESGIVAVGETHTAVARIGKDLSASTNFVRVLSLIHISEPTRQPATSRMPSSA